MTYQEEQLNKYLNGVFKINEKNAVARQIDALRAAGKTDEEIRAANPYFAQELDRQASNINIGDNFTKVENARQAANFAQDLANTHQSEKFDAAADRARGNLLGAEQELEDAKKQAKLNAQQNIQARQEKDLADLMAYKNDANRATYAQKAAEGEKAAELDIAKNELERTKQELEQAKKELEDLKAQAEQGDPNAAKEAEKVEGEVEQKVDEVKEKEAEVENVEAETTTPENPDVPTDPSVLPTNPDNPEVPTDPNGGQPSEADKAAAVAKEEDEKTKEAMKVQPTDTPETVQAKQTFQQEWAELKQQIGDIQTQAKQVMASPQATAYVKQRPDLATKFQKFGGALASVGAILGLAGMITMFINPALGGILRAAGMTLGGVGGATASGANAVTQFKNGNVLGGLGSLAAAGMSATMAGMGGKSLASNIGAMQAANAPQVATTAGTSTGTPNAMSGDPRFAAPTDSNTASAETPTATPATGNATQSFTPGSNPAQFTDRAPTIANTNDAVANAQPGDVIQRNDGTRIELNQGDINWAKAHQQVAPQAPVAEVTPQVTPQQGGATLEWQNPATPKVETYTPNAMSGDPRFAAPSNTAPLDNYNQFKLQTTPGFNLNNLNNPNLLKPNFNNSLNDYNMFKNGNTPNLQPKLNVNPLFDYNNYKTQPAQPQVVPNQQALGSQYFSNPKVI